MIKADLHGLTALVTGGRIKIGFEIALKLLKDGAEVFITSRFSNDTLIRYQK
jgi:NAD(P)-dependent dehydrogenase (short-subunit alcohol dehydrogenase family)